MSKYLPTPGDVLPLRDLYGTRHHLKVVAVKRYYGKYGGQRVKKSIPIYGDGILSVLSRDLQFRIKHQYDNVIVVTGEERVGKSHFAIRLAMTMDPTFNVDRVLFDVYDDIGPVMRQMTTPGRVVIIDEAGREINSRSWSKKEQKELVTKFQVFGKLQATVILVMPRLSYLDSAIRDTRLKYWIKCKAEKNGRDRGYIYVQESKRNDYTNDTYWDLKYAGKVKPPNEFPEMADVMAQYEAKKDAYIQSILQTPEEETGKATEQRNRLIWFAIKADLLNYAELETLTGLSASTMRGIKAKVDKQVSPAMLYTLGFQDEIPQGV